MKLNKIIIVPIALLLLFAIAIAPTIYSRTIISMVGWNKQPEKIEKIYGEFDVEIDNTIDPDFINGYYAYRMGSPIFRKNEMYFVIEFDSPKHEESRIKYHIFTGTDWIEEVTLK